MEGEQMDYSEAGFALTRSFEGLRLEPYRDSAGVWTVGYGHTGPDVVPGRPIPEVMAEALLKKDLGDATACVRRAVRTRLKQFQFDALVDFCFNVGRGHFERSDLLQRVNAADFAGAAEQFARWVHVEGSAMPGLVRRRAAEAAMFRGLEAEGSLARL